MNEIHSHSLKFAASLVVLFVVAAITGCASQPPASRGVSTGEGATGAKLIMEVIATEDAQSYVVFVKGNRQLTYTSVKQNLPLGVLFYFPETAIDPTVPPALSPGNEVIESVEASQISDKQNMSRLLITLKKDTPYEVIPENSGIKIAFAKPLGASPPAPSAAAPAAAVQAATVAAAGAASKDAAPATRLKGIFAVKSEEATKINVSADGTIRDYKVFTLDDPARIVIDIPKLSSPFQGEQVVKINTKWVIKARHCGYTDKVRLVLDTRAPYLKTYTLLPVKDGLLIQVGDRKSSSGRPAASPAPLAAAATAPSAAATLKPAPVQKPVKAAAADKPAWINRIDFSSDQAGKSTLMIGTTRPVKYDLKKSGEKLLQLTLYDTKLPKYRNRPLITTRFESAVNRVTPVVRPSMGDTAMVAIELREMVPYDVEQTDDLVLVKFAASSIPPKPLEEAALPAWKKVMNQTDAGGLAGTAPDSAAAPPAAAVAAEPPPAAAAGSAEAAAIAAAPAPAKPMEAPVMPPEPVAPTAPLQAPPPPYTGIGAAGTGSLSGTGTAPYATSLLAPKQYTGEKIALDFYETDLKNVFRIIREISGKNFAIDKNVTGNVTLTLEKPVPWDQVLDLVLKMNGLGMAYEGDIIRIATLATLTAEEKARRDRITAEQKSLKAVEALEPLVTEYIPVNYSDANTEVMPLVEPVLTPKRGTISVDQRNNQLIVTDTAAKIIQIKEIVSRIDTVTPQVIIESKVVEVSDEFSMELGITWGFSWGPIQGALGTDGDLTMAAAMNFPSQSTSAVGFDFAKLTGTNFLLSAALDAVEANKKGRIITAPKIVTLDNKKARIKQGVEWPYLERDSSGNATVKFKNIDLLLEVTPTVTPDDRILMKIFITKNDIGTLTLGVPSLNTNEAQTELLVNDGDTIVIGGIIKNNRQDSETGWPGLKDVPMLGWLFKTTNESTQTNELLIFITPRIVQLEQRRLL